MKIIILWSLIILLSCVIYFTGISHESFWYDEAFSFSMTNHNFFDIISKTAYDNHPPLYYLILKIFRMIFGNSEWALRLLSVIGAVATVSLGAGPVRRIFGNKTAVFYAIVIMFIPGVLIYAHEARMYSLAILAVTAGALYGYIAAKENRMADWIRFGIATLAAAYLHYYALIAVFFMHLAVFLWLVIKNRKYLKPCIITGIIVLAAYLPWVIFFIKQIKDVKNGFFIPQVSLTEIYLALNKPFIYDKQFFPTITVFMSLALLLFIILIICGFVFSRLKNLEKEKEFGIFSLTVYLGTFILPVILSLVLTPVFTMRYVIVCVGLLAILASIGIATLPVKFLQPAALIIFAAMNVFTIKNIYLEKFNHPMKAVYLDMKNEIKSGDLIVVSDSYSMGPAMYYFPQAFIYYSVNSFEAKWKHVLIPLSPPLNFNDDPKDLFKTHNSFWYITCNTGLSKNVWTILNNEKGWMENTKPKTYSEKYSSVAFTVRQFVKTDAVNTLPRGAVKVHITGLRKTGLLLALLFNRGGLLKEAPPCRQEYINVSGNEMDYSFDGLDYGEFAIILAHDENSNHMIEFEKDGRPKEGMFIMNLDKLGKTPLPEDFTFEKLKFNFNQPEMTVNARMTYPSSE